MRKIKPIDFEAWKAQEHDGVTVIKWIDENMLDCLTRREMFNLISKLNHDADKYSLLELMVREQVRYLQMLELP